MKTIGLLGGVSWESTQVYYQKLNLGVQAKLGGLASAKILLHSFDFSELVDLQNKAEWELIDKLFVSAGQGLQNQGADALLICSNTSHRSYKALSDSVGVKVLHIADCTRDVLVEKGIKTAGLIGTRFAMEPGLLINRLESGQGPKIVLPQKDDAEMIDKAIYDDLAKGHFPQQLKDGFLSVLDRFKKNGVEAAIFGCTEIGLLLKNETTPLLCVDTLDAHVEKAIDFALCQTGTQNNT